jgi:tRNA-dihydrouridine synthase A
MNESTLVRDAVKAMRDAVGPAMPVTVKHRIGIGRTESHGFVRDFIGTVSEAGCQVFIVHARNAWLEGLSPKDNREIPLLRYDVVSRLKREFPGLTIVINGGFKDNAAIADQWPLVDGVMVGRQAYHEPALMACWDAALATGASALTDVDPGDDWRQRVEDEMVAYMERLQGVPWTHAARHMLGLWNGRPGARRWRQVWSDHRLKGSAPLEVQRLARAARKQGATAVESTPPREEATLGVAGA